MNNENIKVSEVIEDEEKEILEDAEVIAEEQLKTESKKEKKNKNKEQIEKLEKELSKVKEDYLRARAEMENAKKRLAEENIQNRKYASISLIEELINPVDMFNKVVNMEQPNPELNNFLIGFKMIANQIVEALKNDGLIEIEALGKEFDPNLHHAVSKEAGEGLEPNKVIEVLQTGYKYKDRILRPAMVKVSE